MDLFGFQIISLVATLQRELDAPKLKQLSSTEWSILSDYVNLMAPLAVGLNRLQGENNASLGYVMPTLYTIKKKISPMPTISPIGERMKDSLRNSLDSRFEKLLKFDESNRDPIVAAISHPLFKLNWIDNEHDRTVARDIFNSAVLEFAATGVDEHLDNRTNALHFFDHISDNNSRRSSTDSSFMDFLNYLNDSRRELTILHQMPTIKKVFIKFNATLSSSAPVERLFSQAMIIFTPRRNRLSSSNFEKSLIVKHNNSLFDFK